MKSKIHECQNFVGEDAGGNNINGTGLVEFGYGAGLFRSGNSFCTFIGFNSDNVTATNLSNANAFGHLSKATDFNQVRIGNTSVGSIGGFVGFTNVSDGRYKKNVTQNVPGLEFINKLNPVTYTLDVKGLQIFLHENDNLNEYVKSVNLKAAEDKEKIVYTGFIAQEVEAAAKELNYDFSGVDKPHNDESLYGLRYAEFTVPLVKAVQELSKENEELKSEIENLKSEVTSRKSENGSRSSDIRPLTSDLLFQNQPNPFSEKTIVRCEVNTDFSSAKIVIRNLDGAVMMEQIISAKGKNKIEVYARTLSAGTYTYTLEINNV
ncbi:MAG: tail fiber domain-containing protein, partial [Bacteroidota bacterium]